MSKEKTPAGDRQKPGRDLPDKELDKASGGAGPAPVGGQGTYPTPDDRAKWPAKG